MRPSSDAASTLRKLIHSVPQQFQIAHRAPVNEITSRQEDWCLPDHGLHAPERRSARNGCVRFPLEICDVYSKRLQLVEKFARQAAGCDPLPGREQITDTLPHIGGYLEY